MQLVVMMSNHDFDSSYAFLNPGGPHHRSVSAQHSAVALASLDFDQSDLITTAGAWDNNWPQHQLQQDQAYDPAILFSPASTSAAGPSPIVQQAFGYGHSLAQNSYNEGLGLGDIQVQPRATTSWAEEGDDLVGDLDDRTMASSRRAKRQSLRSEPYPATPSSPAKRGHAARLSLSAIASPFGDLNLAGSVASGPGSPHPLTPLTPNSPFGSDFTFGTGSSSGSSAASKLGSQAGPNRNSIGLSGEGAVPTTPSRSSPSKRGSYSKHTKRNSVSPHKPSTSQRSAGRKLTIEEKQELCVYKALHDERNPNPTKEERLKQETIALYFDVERSTVSKIVNNPQKWFADDSQGWEHGFEQAMKIGRLKPEYDHLYRGATKPDAFARASVLDSVSVSAASPAPSSTYDAPTPASAPMAASLSSKSNRNSFRQPSVERDLDISVDDHESFNAEQAFRIQPTKRQAAMFASKIFAPTPTKTVPLSTDSEATPTGSRTTSSSTLTEQFNAHAAYEGQNLSRPASGLGIQPQLVQPTQTYEEVFSPAEFGHGFEQQNSMYTAYANSGMPSFDYGSPQLEQSPYLANAATLPRAYQPYPQQQAGQAQFHHQHHDPNHHRAMSSGQTSPTDPNFPAPHHVRNGSFASTSSSVSAFTGFSSSATGTPSTGPLCGGPFPGANSNGGSPLQPQPQHQGQTHAQGQHYYGHADATLAQAQQIQAAFDIHSRSQSNSPPDQHNIRHGQTQTPTLDQALASLQLTMRFLRSSDAHGLALPKDLIALQDLSTKMTARLADPGQGQRHAHAQAQQAQRGQR